MVNTLSIGIPSKDRDADFGIAKERGIPLFDIDIGPNLARLDASTERFAEFAQPTSDAIDLDPVLPTRRLSGLEP